MSAKKSVSGTMFGRSGKFTGLWEVNGVRLGFDGLFFGCDYHWKSTATLEYDDLEDLTGRYGIDVSETPYVGPDDLCLLFTDHAGKKFKITGSLEHPIGHRGIVVGEASWERI